MPRAADHSDALVRVRQALAVACFVIVGFMGSPLAHALTVEQITSPKGIQAWLVEEHSVPVIALQFAFAGGAAENPRGKEGLATLVSDLLTEGAADLSASDYKHRLSGLGARISLTVGRDAIYGSFETLSRRLSPSAELLRLALTAPRFDPEAIERVKAQSLTNLALSANEPRTMALNQWYAQAFAGNNYSRSVDGTTDSIKGLTADDIRAQHARLFAKQSLKVVVVGDIDRLAAGDALDAIFGGLPDKASLAQAGRVEPRSLPAPPIVTEKDIPLATAMFGLPALRPDHPDFPALQVLNHIIGSGSFDSRLMDEIRVKRGLAYSVKTSLVHDSMASLLLGGFSTKNENMGAALRVLRDVLASTARDGPTPSEFDNAKRYLTGSFLLDFDTSAKVAGSLMRFWLNGEGPNYLHTRNQKFDAVTVGDVKRVAAAALAADRLIITVVGKPKLD